MDDAPRTPPPPPLQQQQQPPHQDSTSITTTNNNQNGTKNPTHAMENFRALVYKLALTSTKTSSLGPTQTSLLEQRLNDFFAHFHTPDHPPYSAMIHSAIQQLNDERGSSEQAISEIIKENCNDLPWVHDTLLKHHLRELCRSGDIVKNCDGCYLLDDAGTRVNPVSSPSPPSSAVASPSCSLMSSSSSSSSSGSNCSSISCSSSSSISDHRRWIKKKRQLWKQRKGQRRGKGRQQGRRVEAKEGGVRRPTRRRGRPSNRVVRKKIAEQMEATEKEEIGVTDNEDEYEFKGKDEFQPERHQAESEECGKNEHCEEDKTKNSEIHEQGHQANKKPGRRKRRAHRNSVKPLRWEPGRERGRTRRKRFSAETQPFTEEEDQPSEQCNMAIEERKEVLGKPFATPGGNQAEGTNNFIGIVPQFCEVEDVDELVERKKQRVVSGDRSNDVISEINHLMPHACEVVEEKNNSLLLQQKVTAEKCQQQGQEAETAKWKDTLMEEQIEATSEHELPVEGHEVIEVPKRKRGRRPKSSGGGKEIQRKRPQVPGRGRGRPRKIDISSEGNQTTVKQIEAREPRDVNTEEIVFVSDEENEPIQQQNLVDGDEGQVEGKQLEISEPTVPKIIMVIDTEVYGQGNLVTNVEGNDENEQEKEVSAVHNQPEAIGQRIEPGEHPVKVIDKQDQLQEQEGVIDRPMMLKEYDILDEFTKWLESKT